MGSLLSFLYLLKHHLVWQHIVTHIHAAKGRVEGWLGVLIVFEIGHPSVEVHNLKRVVTEHLKTLLAFKQTHNANQHCKRFADVKQPLQYLPF